MAIIELVDRDMLAKKIDIKKKTEEPVKDTPASKSKILDKKTKPKK